MLKLIKIIILCLIICDLHGQHSIRKKKEPTIKTFISPTFSTYSSDIFPGKYSRRVNKEMWRQASGWSFGMEYGMRLTKKIDFSTGVGYNLFHINQTSGFGYWVCDPSNSYVDDIDHVERVIRIQTLQIPLQMRYRFAVNKVVLYPAAGITTSYVLKKDQYVDFILNSKELVKNSENDLVLDHNRTLNISPFLKLGVGYSFNPKVKVKSEFYYALTLGKEDLFNYLIKEYETVNIASIGMSLGIEYSLKMTKR